MIYEYQCLKCDERFEKVRPSDDCKKKTRCPSCGKFTKNLLIGLPFLNTGKGSRFPGVCNSFEGPNPVYIRNKSHFREECKKRDLTPVAL